MKKRTTFIVSFLAPAVLLYGLFVVVPLLQAFYFSMFAWRGVSSNMKFVGAANLTKVVGDPLLKTAGINQFLLLSCGGALLILLSVSIAHALLQPSRLGKIIQSVLLFPHVISTVVVALIWYFMWNPSFGLITKTGNLLGLPLPTSGVLGTYGWANMAILIAFVWQALGFYVILFGAGIKSIDGEIIEASALDGADGMARFRLITWPLLWSVKRVAVMYVVSNVMAMFVLVKLMTNMNPDGATHVFLTWMHQKGWEHSKMGEASAIAVVSFIVSIVLGSLVWRIVGRDPQLPSKKVRA
ncbi:MAG TPA: sugar ABC transporter permease [Fimbriimonas sp.]|nr:sugar ABC transporter permease [Fimbriimonas sp.]